MPIASKDLSHQAYVLLRIVFIVAPIIAGLDKYFDILTDWDQYLAPFWGSFGHPLMLIVGVIEVIAGIGMIFKPRIFANIVGLWLAAIVINLLILGDFFDIALRDVGLCLSAFACGRLAKVYS